MSDFMKQVPKKNVTVKMDPDDVALAKKKNINISKVCRYALRMAIEGKLGINDKNGRASA